MRPASLFRAHQVGYSWVVRCEACPTSFPEVLSPLCHEAFRPQIFLLVYFGDPYLKAYTGRASIPSGGADKEEEECETEPSSSLECRPPARGKTLKVGAYPLPSSVVGASDSSEGVNESPLEVLPISVWSPTLRGTAPSPIVPDEVTGNRDHSEIAGMRTLCFLMQSSPPGLFPPS